MKPLKILIAGIGGVGGYFGGLLAKKYEHDARIDIIFLARGKHLTAIQNKGLNVIRGDKSFICHPNKTIDKVEEIGIVDGVVICTKTYDLKKVIHQLKACIDEQTLILPLLNGVNNQAIIQELLPNHQVLNGCVYIVSRLKEAGVVENSGNIEKLYFGGSEKVEQVRLEQLEKIFQEAAIDAKWAKNIDTIIWEKYIFISSVASATAYFDSCLGEILANEQQFAKLQALLKEVSKLAQVKNIPIASNIISRSIQTMKQLPFETTSSMHSDFINQAKNNELEALTAFVVKEGEKLGVKVTTYKEVYARLCRK